MIGIKALVLFLVTLGAGLLVLTIPDVSKRNFKFILILSGAYLLSLTILHILPELFEHGDGSFLIPLMILAGIFLQMLLESFTSGIEHGHWHDHGMNKKSMAFPLGLVMALGIHSLIEGTVLAHGGDYHDHGNGTALLLGILLHKIPAAIALMSVLLYEMGNKKRSIIILTIFASASPIGMLFTNYLQAGALISSEIYNVLLALAAGSFIYISATILFEARKDHRIYIRDLIPALIGAMMAIAFELMI